MLIELEIMPKWIPKMMTGRNYTEHRVDGKTKLYDRSGYLIELERNVSSIFYYSKTRVGKIEKLERFIMECNNLDGMLQFRDGKISLEPTGYWYMPNFNWSFPILGSKV